MHSKMWYILHKAEMDKLHIKCKIDSIFQDDDKIKDSTISSLNHFRELIVHY